MARKRRIFFQKICLWQIQPESGISMIFGKNPVILSINGIVMRTFWPPGFLRTSSTRMRSALFGVVVT
jgi:hypothetical protein